MKTKNILLSRKFVLVLAVCVLATQTTFGAPTKRLKPEDFKEYWSQHVYDQVSTGRGEYDIYVEKPNEGSDYNGSMTTQLKVGDSSFVFSRVTGSKNGIAHEGYVVTGRIQGNVRVFDDPNAPGKIVEDSYTECKGTDEFRPQKGPAKCLTLTPAMCRGVLTHFAKAGKGMDFARAVDNCAESITGITSISKAAMQFITDDPSKKVNAKEYQSKADLAKLTQAGLRQANERFAALKIGTPALASVNLDTYKFESFFDADTALVLGMGQTCMNEAKAMGNADLLPKDTLLPR